MDPGRTFADTANMRSRRYGAFITSSLQLDRARKATENVWRGVESEYGMLTSTEVARLIGSENSGRSFTSGRRAASKLIGIRRANRILYPGFQFDRLAGKILPAIPELLHMAEGVGRDQEDLVFWLVSPSRYFDGDRSVDHLDDADLLDKGRQKATVEW